MTGDGRYHQPVLLRELLGFFAPLGGVVVDATVGGGGHAAALLEASAEVCVVGLDRDPEALAEAGRRLSGYEGRYNLVQGDFSELPRILGELGRGEVRGVYADLGVSSHQLDAGARGFSIRRNGPLDMRMAGAAGAETAGDLLDRLPVAGLEELLREYGEIRAALPLARALKTARRQGRLGTTRELAALCEGMLPRRGRIHPATTVFQALRIAVNDELVALDRLLAAAPALLEAGGLLGVLSYHSLEDRRVKNALRDGRRDGLWEVLTPRPILPSEEEERLNPRSRSAKLRVARRRS